VSIRIDPKYGVNPSVFHCFYCGESAGVALFGRLRGGGEAPRDCGVIDVIPCSQCEEYMRQGVILISVRDGEEGENPYRTGCLVVVKDRAIRDLLAEPIRSKVLEMRFAFVPDSVWDAWGLPREDGATAGTEEKERDGRFVGKARSDNG